MDAGGTVISKAMLSNIPEKCLNIFIQALAHSWQGSRHMHQHQCTCMSRAWACMTSRQQAEPAEGLRQPFHCKLGSNKKAT